MSNPDERHLEFVRGIWSQMPRTPDFERAESDVDQTERWVAHDHQTLLSVARSVEVALESHQPCEELASRVRELAELFAAHCRDEEQTPFYAVFPSRYPPFAHELECALQEHGSLLTELRAVAVALERRCDPAGEEHVPTHWLTRLRTALGALAAHEAREAELLQRIHHLVELRGPC